MAAQGDVALDDAEREPFDISWSVADHQSARGRNFSERYSGLARDVGRARDAGTWQYFRSHVGPVGTTSTVLDEAGRSFRGVNLGSQDYLGLAGDPRVQRAAIEAIGAFGVHSSGSAPMGGGSVAATGLADTVASTLGLEHALLFPTGWAAGYGAITGIVRAHDHIVMDSLAHNCLQHGARASTQNVSLFLHNSIASLTKRLERIRKNEPDAAIMVVFESLYSMDSDAPDLAELCATARRFDAHTLIDVAHDLGVLGPDGRGLMAGRYGEVDLVVGSFSKVFASIGGFVASGDINLIRALQGFSGSYTFSNFLIPPQIAAASRAFGIAFSPEGASLRETLLGHCRFLRDRLAENAILTHGVDSAMVIVQVGSEPAARAAYRDLLGEGIIVNCIEFPAVRKGEARFRIQLTPAHDRQMLAFAADRIAAAVRRHS